MLITDIARALQNGANDIELNALISDFIVAFSDEDIQDWRKAHHFELRGWAYPDFKIRLDADVKINSGITELIAEGESQLSSYYTNCLSVKERFPKP